MTRIYDLTPAQAHEKFEKFMAMMNAASDARAAARREWRSAIPTAWLERQPAGWLKAIR